MGTSLCGNIEIIELLDSDLEDSEDRSEGHDGSLKRPVLADISTNRLISGNERSKNDKMKPSAWTEARGGRGGGNTGVHSKNGLLVARIDDDTTSNRLANQSNNTSIASVTTAPALLVHYSDVEFVYAPPSVWQKGGRVHVAARGKGSKRNSPSSDSSFALNNDINSEAALAETRGQSALADFCHSCENPIVSAVCATSEHRPA